MKPWHEHCAIRSCAAPAVCSLSSFCPTHLADWRDHLASLGVTLTFLGIAQEHARFVHEIERHGPGPASVRIRPRRR